MSFSKDLSNTIDFQLPLENQPYIFQQGLFSRELDPINENKARTVTIKCTQLYCKAIWKNQRIGSSTSNYIKHYHNNHKAIPTNKGKEIEEGSSQASFSQQSSIIEFYKDSRKRGYSQVFSEKELKRKIINFMISNNLSINCITSRSFRDLLLYAKQDEEIPSLYRQNIIDSLYHIESKGKFSFTLDAWTASNQTEYLGIT
ncbi:hypothetical protein V497_02726, partial [Pseudogymnoascus sp. VKM F-4516 (FW-969)]